MDQTGLTFVEIILKIREMRRGYVNELKRFLRAKSNGHCYRITVPWFYDLHRFLYPYLDYDEAVELHVRIDKLVMLLARWWSTVFVDNFAVAPRYEGFNEATSAVKRF